VSHITEKLRGVNDQYISSALFRVPRTGTVTANQVRQVQFFTDRDIHILGAQTCAAGVCVFSFLFKKIIILEPKYDI